MFDLTVQEKKVIIALSAFAILGLAVLAYRTYFARPELKITHAADYKKIIEDRSAVNINTAGASGMETLPGIGPKLAKEIVEYRTAHGHFLLKEDLRKVKGIGQDKFDRIKNLIVLE
ncbi:MAG: helix-hairpin-helix domain-containing protein [Candidatus Omnitrophica bacterium]|nr:helix-hairpin-helix domain-containing protein [Candidatus Omnitrophota bacterium]